jgi:hypothetical protein
MEGSAWNMVSAVFWLKFVWSASVPGALAAPAAEPGPPAGPGQPGLDDMVMAGDPFGEMGQFAFEDAVKQLASRTP